MLTVVAFVVALGVLIAAHEYGHYRVAVACGVKVLRFSLGFGTVLLRWQRKNSPTEFVICIFPLGGYVKMLDEREAPVLAQERHLAFNNRPLWARAAVVAAGPVANLLLAVLLYAVVSWSGVEQPRAVLASPLAGSIAQRAGLVGGERVERAGFEGEALKPIESFDEVRWLLTRGALEGRDVRLVLGAAARGASGEVVLRLSGMDASEVDARLMRRIGIPGPFTRPVMGEILPGGAADRAGLRPGDAVVRVGATPVVDAQQLRELIRASNRQGAAMVWAVVRAGVNLELVVRPDVRPEGEVLVGKIGAYIGTPPEFVTIRHGLAGALWQGLENTWDVSVLTLRTMGKMVVGAASLKNLSGPLTIADYAGKSAHQGLTQYLVFLALISVSLGVLNLLPLPILDGGHLMYYLWEGLTGKSVSDAWMERLQRGGIAVLLVMMSIAIFNDLVRLFG